MSEGSEQASLRTQVRQEEHVQQSLWGLLRRECEFIFHSSLRMIMIQKIKRWIANRGTIGRVGVEDLLWGLVGASWLGPLIFLASMESQFFTSIRICYWAADEVTENSSAESRCHNHVDWMAQAKVLQSDSVAFIPVFCSLISREVRLKCFSLPLLGTASLPVFHVQDKEDLSRGLKINCSHP